MILTIMLMGFATVAVGLLPPASAIGLGAPILLVLFRALQGFGAGAELSGALTVVSEFVSPRRRGLVTGLVNGTAGGGVLLATITFTIVIGLPKDDLMSWGWRIPFLLSAVLFFLAPTFARASTKLPSIRKPWQVTGPRARSAFFTWATRCSSTAAQATWCSTSPSWSTTYPQLSSSIRGDLIFTGTPDGVGFGRSP
jgi:MFS family permease